MFILNVSKTQGTAWYTKLKYGPMVEFGNLLNYTAMGVGNHDFDDSVEGFVPFAEQVVFVFDLSNDDDDNSRNETRKCALQGSPFHQVSI